MKHLNLTDNNLETCKFTWRRKNSIEKSRIAFWLKDDNITAQVVSADIRPAIIKSTDHLAVSLKIKSCRKPGPGYWILNNNYLNDDDYFYLISNVFDSCCSQLSIQSAQIKWEICKIEIKSKSIDYAKLKQGKEIILYIS